MRRQRAFGGTSSPHSIFLGFLDVVSCGFAAALVLAIIYSICQPSANPGVTTPSKYAYFEFMESGPEDGAFQNGHLAILRPVIFFTPPNGQRETIRCDFTMNGDLVARSSPTRLDTAFFGCSSDPSRLLLRKDESNSSRQYWGVLISQIPENSKVDVQMIYSDITENSVYLAASPAPALTLKRSRIPGESEPGSPQAISYGKITTFTEQPN